MRIDPLRAAWLALLLAVLPTARAATITVTTEADQNGTDPGACSLREALQAASLNAAFGGCSAGAAGLDTINLGVGTYRLTLGEIAVNTPVIIAGVSAASTHVVARSDARAFYITTSTSFLVRMDIQGGDVTADAFPNGGVVLHRFGGDLGLTDVVLRGGTAVNGGGLYDASTSVGLLRTALYDNVATANGGGATVAAPTSMSLTNTTVSGNRAQTGGGLYSDSVLTLRNVTVARNRALGSGGGLAFFNTFLHANDTVISNSAIVDNGHDVGGDATADLFCSGTSSIAGGRYNLVARTTCALSDAAGTSLSGDPRLSPLFDFGNGIPTHALLDGSALIDAGAPPGSPVTCSTPDARNVPRPSSACDVGAFERAFDVTVNTLADLPDANPGNGLCATSGGQCSLRALFEEARVSGGRWMARLPAGTYNLNQPAGPLRLTTLFPPGPGLQVALFGESSTTTQVHGDLPGARVFWIQGEDVFNNDVRMDLALIGLGINGGRQSNDGSDGGGLLLEGGDLLVHESVFSDNRVERGSGGGLAAIDPNEGAGDPVQTRVWIERSAFLGNRANSDQVPIPAGAARGGGLYVEGANVTVVNSTFDGNFARAVGGGVAIDGTGNGASTGISFSTITNNTVDSGTGTGGGIDGDANLRVNASLIGDNRLDPANVASDCNGAIPSLGYNLIETTNGCTLSGDTATNITGTDPRLGIVEVDGIPIRAPRFDSPARDAIPAAACDNARRIRQGYDARRDPRPDPMMGLCDIGAREGISDVIFIDGFE